MLLNTKSISSGISTMGKKSSGKNYTSKGERPNTNRSITKSVRQNREGGVIELNKINAWKNGKNPWITVPNSGNDAGKMPYIRVKANELWGDPRGRRN